MSPSIARLAFPVRVVSATRRCVALAFALAALLSAPTPALGAIFTCPTPSGTIVFQDRPCARTVSPADAPRAARTRAPAGIHESWFARPGDTGVVARCDDAGCRCDALARPFDSGLPLAVADALYLDGAWHRHDEAVDARDRPAADGESPDSLALQVDEAACDVLISQRILRTHATAVLAELRRRTREAEERGYDDGRACDAGDPHACEYVDAISLYRRMVADLAALRAPRAGDVGEP